MLIPSSYQQYQEENIKIYCLILFTSHVNGEPVQGLFHTQVLQLLLNNGNNEHVTLRTTPLEYTSIQTGGRRRDVHQSKLAKKSVSRQKKQRKDTEKKRKTSLFRRISTKRASAEMQHLTSGLPSPTVTPSKSCQSFSIQSVPGARDDCQISGSSTPPRPAHLNRLSLSPLDNIPAPSSQSSSPSSSAPNTPTSLSNSLVLGAQSHLFHHHHHHHQRPSTLHGLKHKLHPSVANGKFIAYLLSNIFFKTSSSFLFIKPILSYATLFRQVDLVRLEVFL